MVPHPSLKRRPLGRPRLKTLDSRPLNFSNELTTDTPSKVSFGWKKDILVKVAADAIKTLMPSEIAGTGFLWVILAASALVAYAKRNAFYDAASIVPFACLTLAIQAVHCAEEFATGFHRSAPSLLGLVPWSPAFFVSFNLAWIALWSLAVGAVSSRIFGWPVMTALWFLGFAAIANGFAHPLISLLTAAYFSGTVSAVPLGISGFLLTRRMFSPQHP